MHESGSMNLHLVVSSAHAHTLENSMVAYKRRGKPFQKENCPLCFLSPWLLDRAPYLKAEWYTHDED
jgi:hypothetical protein